MTKKIKSELLLPVSSMKMLEAAIHNGADAVYIGMPEFNARGRTEDLTLDQLKEMIELAHLYGVKVYLAFNILIFEEEFLKVYQAILDILPLFPDAFIVQDLGLAKFLKTISPDIVLHGSTQMTITNSWSLNLLADLDFKRVVLGREVSLKEMKVIKKETEMELEVFVHGALCVAYSGQCFTSEGIGGRSANRGQCAQSCRFSYDLFVDSKKIDLGEKKYLVSPLDLCGIAEIPELLDLKIESFKVEGRLKTPEYVAATASAYREKIDHNHPTKNNLESIFKMGLTYSRGFFSGWLKGVDHQKLVDGTFSSHRGHLIGEVVSRQSSSITIQSNYLKLKKGDGVLIAGVFKNEKMEIGGKLYEVKYLNVNHEIQLFFSHQLNLNKINKGFKVYLNSDPLIEKNLTASYTQKDHLKRIPLTIEVFAKVGFPLELKVLDGENDIFLKSESLVEAAVQKVLDKDFLSQKLGALSATCFKLKDLSFSFDQNAFIHEKELKILRQKFTDELMKKRISRKKIVALNPLDLLLNNDLLIPPNLHRHLNILLREVEQVKSLLLLVDAIRDILGVVYLDFDYGRDYLSSVLLLKAAKVKVGVATTRILKPNEYYHFKIIEEAKPDVILCRNLGAIFYFKEKDFELRGDFSLNVSNSLTAKYLLAKNLTMVSASYDLNENDLMSLAQKMVPGSLEVTIHQYMPSFHMEHCVFAAFLSKGSSYKDCGKPCEKYKVELRDQFLNFHHIKADQECRNTMFNGMAESLAKQVFELLKNNVTEFRFEALNESESELKDKLLIYASLLRAKDHNLFDQNISLKLKNHEKHGIKMG